jgi:hypothetical protein
VSKTGTVSLVIDSDYDDGNDLKKSRIIITLSEKQLLTG